MSHSLLYAPNWYRPFKNVQADHPAYNVEIKTSHGKINKILFRDCLKKVKNHNGQAIMLRSPTQHPENDTHIVGYDNDVSSLQYEDNKDHPHVNRLQLRPCIAPETYFELNAIQLIDL